MPLARGGADKPSKIHQQKIRDANETGQGKQWQAHLQRWAQALFPRVDVTLKTADALLILEAGRISQHI